MKERRSKVKLLCDAGSAMLRRTLGQASKAGIVAALVPLGMIGLPGAAHAQESTGPSSYVDGTVTPQGGGRYLYEFTVYNTSAPGDDDDDAYGGYGGNFLIVDWELPLMVGPGQDYTDVVDTIMSPTGYPTWAEPGPVAAVSESHTWYYEVIDPVDGFVHETNDPDFIGPHSDYYANASGPYGYYDWAAWTKEADPVWQADSDVYGPDPDMWLNPDYLIHWYTPDVEVASPLAPIGPGQLLAGFSFMSDFSAGNAPYLASWEQEPPTIGDPPFPVTGLPAGLPGSPGPTGPIIPLPAAFPAAFLVMTGMAGVAYLRRRAAR